MKVFIADDSILIRNILKDLLSNDASIRVVGEAANGADAVDRALAIRPDIVIMDVDMPVMNGLEATSLIVAAAPIPVVVFTHNADPELPFRAIERGAVDFLPKPDFADLNRPDYVRNFIERLKALASGRRAPASTASLERRSAPAKPRAPYSGPERRSALAKPYTGPERRAHPHSAQTQREKPPAASYADALPSTRPAAILVGASTGGPQAVSVLLAALPAPFPLPIAIVQHIETGFDKGYADWLSSETGHRVALARSGEEPLPGRVYVAPTDYHLRLTTAGFALDDGPKVLNQKPAVDVLFSSGAERYAHRALAVLLTGMGTDGAEGCASILSHGGCTVVQDEASSLIYGMPKAAIERGAASVILPLEEIASFVQRAAGRSF